MRSWTMFRKYDGMRLNTPNSLMLVVTNGKVACKIITGKKRTHKRPEHTKLRFRMSGQRAVSLIKSRSKSVFKFLNT